MSALVSIAAVMDHTNASAFRLEAGPAWDHSVLVFPAGRDQTSRRFAAALAVELEHTYRMAARRAAQRAIYTLRACLDAERYSYWVIVAGPAWDQAVVLPQVQYPNEAEAHTAGAALMRAHAELSETHQAAAA